MSDEPQVVTMLSRDMILAQAKGVQFQVVEVPEWGGAVRIRSLTALERDRFEASMIKRSRDGSVRTDPVGTRARLVQLVCVDDKGDPLFVEGDIPGLNDQPVSVIQRIFNAAQDMNAISNEDMEEIEGE